MLLPSPLLFLPACPPVKTKYLSATQCKVGALTSVGREMDSDAARGPGSRHNAPGSRGHEASGNPTHTACGLLRGHRTAPRTPWGMCQEAPSSVPGTIKTGSGHDDKATEIVPIRKTGGNQNSRLYLVQKNGKNGSKGSITEAKVEAKRWEQTVRSCKKTGVESQSRSS